MHTAAPTATERLKEALLTALLSVLTRARFPIPVKYYLEATYIRLSCISHMVAHLSASTSTLQVSASLTSCRSMFCCSTGYTSLTKWLMKWASVFCWAVSRNLKVNLSLPAPVFPAALHNPDCTMAFQYIPRIFKCFFSPRILFFFLKHKMQNLFTCHYQVQDKFD